MASPRKWLADNGLAHLLEPFDQIMDEAVAIDKERRRRAKLAPPEGKTRKKHRRLAADHLMRMSLGEWCRRFHRDDLIVKWHPAKNSVGMDAVPHNSTECAWWLCPECGYEWESPVSTSVSGFAPCPAHTPGKRVIPGVNDLAVRGADFARYYSSENELPPEMISDRHDFKLKWKCPTCGHSWDARLTSFPDHRPVCPKCEPWHYSKPDPRKRVKPGTTDLVTKCPSVVDMWHPTKNGGRKPWTTPYKTRDKVWWICPECGDSWKGSVFYVTNKKSARCPSCIKKRKEQKREEERRLEEKRKARRKLLEQRGIDPSKCTATT